jgi:CheY-like chemotaxis protein
LSVKLVLLANLDDFSSFPDIQTVPMPAYAVSLAKALNGEAVTGNQRVEGFAPRFVAPKARVLVVDDNLTNLKVTQGFLLPHKIQVELCESGEAAVELAKENSYDIIFMDHMMTGMDGVEATARLRAMERHRDTPVIALTANVVSGMKEMFMEKGMSDFLPKPVDPAQLDAVLRRWIPRNKRINASETPGRHRDTSYMPRVPGIDMDTVMKRFSDDLEVWREVVRVYVAHTPEVLDKLRVSAPLSDYGAAAHSLKGSSYNICADLVGKEAGELEATAKAGNLEGVRAMRDPFIRRVETLLAALAAVTEDRAGAEEKKERKASPDKALLKTIFEAAGKYDVSGMDNALRELERNDYESGNELVTWLRTELESLEYDRIRERLGPEADNA